MTSQVRQRVRSPSPVQRRYHSRSGKRTLVCDLRRCFAGVGSEGCAFDLRDCVSRVFIAEERRF